MWSFAEEHFGFWVAMLVVFLIAGTALVLLFLPERGPLAIVLLLAGSAALATVCTAVRWARKRGRKTRSPSGRR
jgi:uncharacterized membrane protein HdeD (DUF308 family)